MSEKLLWHSNSPLASTGYGNQTALFAKRLAEHYDLGVSAFYGVEGNVLPWGGVPIYPALGQTHGNETIREHARVHFDVDLRGGLVVTLMDVWVLDPMVWSQLNTVSWCPIDHDPCPPPIAGYFFDSTAIPLAMSRFGEEKLREVGLDPLYVPHGIDTSVYKPHDKAEAREQNNLPADCFLVGMFAANKGNPSRKNFPEAFEAFKALHAKHENARLYVHAEATGRFDGVNLPELLAMLEIPRELVYYPDQYRVVHYPFPPERMASLYSSCDVVLAPSAGEGFGIPVIEAQACGVPVIVSDFSAQPELVGAGWKVGGQHFYTPLKSFQFKPDIADIYDALTRAYNASAEECAAKARAFAEDYDVERVMERYMLPALKEAQERFAAREAVAV